MDSWRLFVLALETLASLNLHVICISWIRFYIIGLAISEPSSFRWKQIILLGLLGRGLKRLWSFNSESSGWKPQLTPFKTRRRRTRTPLRWPTYFLTPTGLFTIQVRSKARQFVEILISIRHIFRPGVRGDMTGKKIISNTNTMTKTNKFKENLKRATLGTYDLWDIWSEKWNMTWRKNTMKKTKTKTDTFREHLQRAIQTMTKTNTNRMAMAKTSSFRENL